MLGVVLIILSIIFLANKKKLLTFLGTTYFFSCFYVYLGIIYVNELKLVTNTQFYNKFILLILLHFLLTIIFSKPHQILYRIQNKYKKLFFISFLLIIYFLMLAVSSYSSSNLELGRLNLFFSNKILYYNLLFIWPFLFLTQKKVKFIFILIYILTCYLTGFRSLLVNFIFLYVIKEKLVFRNKIFNYKLFTIVSIIISGVLLISFLRKGQFDVQESLIHRVFEINARNIYAILELNNPIYLQQFFQDFVPVRYIFSPFLELYLTTAESLTREINSYYFDTGRIMTPTSLGLLISAFGENSIYLYPFILTTLSLFINKFIKSSEMKIYLIFISISMVTRGIWSVLGLYFVPIWFLSLLAKKVIYKSHA